MRNSYHKLGPGFRCAQSGLRLLNPSYGIDAHAIIAAARAIAPEWPIRHLGVV